jgi:membrane fusion protein (multidrug efflux system)
MRYSGRENKVKRAVRRTLLILIVVLLAAGGYFWFFHGRALTHKEGDKGQEAKEAGGPVARVKTAAIRTGTIEEIITVYGEVMPAPGSLQSVSVPFESRVRRVMVNLGQDVTQAEPLVEVEPSPDTYLKLRQAQNLYETTKQALRHVQDRFDLKLATNDQLVQAKQTAQQAELDLQSMKQRGIGGPQEILADVEGLVNSVSAQVGAIVPAGTPLLQLVKQRRLEARLGVESENIERVRTGMPVFISFVNVPASPALSGTIRKISHLVNPASRVVDVFVSLPPSSKLLLGQSVLGKITVASVQGLVVPRAAVLPEEDKFVLFTVEKGHAVKHTVKPGLDNGTDINVIAPDLRDGTPVVVLGNYELKDKMAVAPEDGAP